MKMDWTGGEIKCLWVSNVYTATITETLKCQLRIMFPGVVTLVSDEDFSRT